MVERVPDLLTGLMMVGPKARHFFTTLSPAGIGRGIAIAFSPTSHAETRVNTARLRSRCLVIDLLGSA